MIAWRALSVLEHTKDGLVWKFVGCFLCLVNCDAFCCVAGDFIVHAD